MRGTVQLLAVVALLAAACGGENGPAPGATVAPSASPAPAEQVAVVGGWSVGTPMPTARSEIASAVLDGKIYVIGGFQASGANSDAVEVYDPASDSWETVAPLPIAVDHAMAVARAGKLYVIGGYRVFGGEISNVTYEYDPGLDRWTTRAPLLLPRAAGAAVVLDDEVIYVIGGVGPEPEVVQVYNPEGASWQRFGSMSTPREHLTAQVVDGKLYVIGGRWEGSNSDAVEAFDAASSALVMATNSSVLAPMPTARGGLASAVLDGWIHVFGGEDLSAGSTFAEHEVFDPAVDGWTAAPPLPTARHGLTAQTVGRRIYVIGGGAQAGLSTSGLVDVFTGEE